MIRKLRKRIIAINVLTTCFILLLAVVFTFSWGVNHIGGESDKRMEAALSGDVLPSVDDPLIEGIAIVYYNTATQSVADFRIGKNADIDLDTIFNYAEYLANRALDKGSIGFLYLKYVKVTNGNIVKIAIANFNLLDGAYGYSWVVLLALVIGLVAYCIISVNLARMALAPVEESWKKQKQFIADASHELKTPLSVIMANTDIIMSHGEETVESQIKWLENTRSESIRMAELVQDLLFLAKNDDGLKVQLTDIDLSDCISTIVLGYDAVFYENQKTFTYDIAPDLHILGNEKQLKQLATILLDNANKYSRGEGNIRLKLAANGKHAQLSVQNDSEQLTDEQLAHLFDRFYTVDPSRNKNNGGNGLGLAIAKTICENHNGAIKAECVDGVTIFTASLPAMSTAKAAKKKQKSDDV